MNFYLNSVTAYRAISNSYSSNGSNEGSSNVTVIVTNTVSAPATATATNTNDDKDTITNSLTGRSFHGISEVVFSLIISSFFVLYDLLLPLFSN